MSLSPCKQCGGALRRSRRNFVERLFYSEAYRCEKCGGRSRAFSIYDFRHVHYVKCPRCHSVDLTILGRRDGVDRMQAGIINLIHRIGGGKLYHCWFCRLQFYDLRQRFNTTRASDSDSVPVPEDSVKNLNIASEPSSRSR